MSWRIWTVALLLGLVVPFAGCRKGGHGLVVAGSTSVQPVMEKIVEAFRRARPGVRVTVEGGGSSAGIMAAVTGAATFGMSSRALKQDHPDEAALRVFPLALDGIAVIVHPSNVVSGLSLDQLRDLFTGRHRTWKAVGGADREVHLIVREEGSGTRGAFDEMVLTRGKEHLRPDAYALVQDSSGGVREVVRGDPDAIGFVSLGVVNQTVRALAIDGVVPTAASVRDGRYRLVRPFLLVAREEPAGLARELWEFAVSSAAEPILAQEGLVRVGR